MALQTVLEKLQVGDEKNILIQGLPSSIEKPFFKLNYAKSVTPLLRTRKIDLAIVFAVNIKQLTAIISDVVPALHPDARLWVAYPNPASKIYSELCRDYNWEVVFKEGYEETCQVHLDSVWTAIAFAKPASYGDKKKRARKLELESV